LNEGTASTPATGVVPVIVRDIMNINATRVRAGTTIRAAVDILSSSNASDLAVVGEDGRLLGVLSEGDLVRAVLPKMSELIDRGLSMQDSYDVFEEKGHDMADERIETLVISNPIVLSPQDNMQKAAALMASQNIRRLPVVENGKLVGTVSRADICRAIFR
jgi:CBS domain-containing protein